MALAAVAVPALAVAGFLGWTLIKTVDEVEADVEASLATTRRIGQIRVLMEKENGLVFRLPAELDQIKITDYAGQLEDLARTIDGEIEGIAANERIVTADMIKSIRDNRAQAKKTTAQIVEAAKSFSQTVAVELANGPFDSSMSTATVLLDAVSSNVNAVAEAARENLKQSSVWAWWLAPIGFLAVMVALGLGLWMVRRSVVRPLGEITVGMGKLTSGDLTVEVSGVSRKDEIGQMARAVLVFRDAAVEKGRLEREAEENRRTAEEERRRNAEAQAKAEREQAAAQARIAEERAAAQAKVAEEQARLAKEQAEAQAKLAEEQAQVVRALAEGLGAIASGNLTYRLDDAFTEAYRQIQDDFNATIERLHDTMRTISVATREVATTTAEISASTTDLSQRTEEQAASLEQTTASMEEISQTVRKNAESAQQANEVAGNTRAVADRGGAVVAQAVGAMARIEESSRKIADIIGVIDEIARQTNLLALNAAVEAARAGDAGRGFAVVASEVRTLAQRSSQAAKDIKELITNSSGQVQEGVDLVNRAGASLSEIVASIKQVADIVSAIAAASAEQSTGIEQVNTALSQMDRMTQQNSALVEQNAAAAKSLEQQSHEMAEQVRFFQVEETRVERAGRKPNGHRAVAA
jgi:methyl-accepting chemotaxis protein